jgi:hypothetical protein
MMNMQKDHTADYLVKFPLSKVENRIEDRIYVLDGTPPNSPPKEGDCLGPFFQRVLSKTNPGVDSREVVQNLEKSNVTFCWNTATRLRGKSRWRMFLVTTKAIRARDRLEALTTYGPAHHV